MNLPILTGALASLIVLAAAADKPSEPTQPVRPSAAKSSVKGDISSKGTKIALNYVTAYQVDSLDEPGHTDVMVVLSDRPLAWFEALDREKLEAMMSGGKLAALKVVLTSDRKVRTSAPYHPALTHYNICGFSPSAQNVALYDTTAKHRNSSEIKMSWEPTASTSSTVAGRFYTNGEQDLAGETWSYDVTFSCPITPPQIGLNPKATLVPAKPKQNQPTKPKENPVTPAKTKASK